MDRIIEINIKDKGILDLNTKNFAIPLIYNINDIKTVGARRGSYSKTIKIIGSKNNNEIFNNLYEIRGINFTYKLRTKYNCSLTVNKIPIFDGFIQLKKITKVLINSTYEIVYEINLFDNIKNLLSDLDEKQLSDLDFSTGFNYDGNTYRVGDHQPTNDLIGDDFDTTPVFTNVYTYPVVDYGYKVNGMSYYYPYVGVLSPGLLYPSVFCKSVIDKIFEESDYDYISELFSGISYDGMFKEMIHLNNKKNEWTNTSLATGINELQTYPSMYPILSGKHRVNLRKYGLVSIDLDYFYGIDLADNIGDVDFGDVNNTIKIKNDGVYDIKYNFEASSYIVERIGSIVTDIIPATQYIYKYSVDDTGGYGVGDLLYTFEDLNTIDIDAGSFGSVDTSGTLSNIEMNEGDIIVYKHGMPSISSSSGPPNATFYTRYGYPKYKAAVELVFKKTSLIEEIDDVITDITPFAYIKDVLPEMSQGDYIRNYIKMFNLYLYNDKFDDKSVTIEPRDDFYGGETLNWSDKIDYNKAITIIDTNVDISKELIFTHQQGEDYNSSLYADTNNITYGEKIINVDGNISKDNDTTETDYQSYLMLDNILNTVMVKLNQEEETSPFDERESYDPLIGFINTTYGVGLVRICGYNNDNWYNKRVEKYNYASHAKVIGGVSYDTNFQTTGQTFDMTGYVNTDGLYNIFWSNYINNLVDEDARKVTMYVKLEINDIINLDLRNKILIDGQVYILEKLEYDPSNDESSKITLIKEILNEPGSFTPEDLLLLNDSGEFITTNDTDDKIEI